MVREEAFRSSRLWAGTAKNEPKLFSGWHHHGAFDSAIYVLRGRVRIECGPGGKTILDARTGDYLFIPAGEIHREGNPGDETAEVVVVRGGQGEIVVNVSGPGS
jgi:uncharacterized RmlC-like cupin family protein